MHEEAEYGLAAHWAYSETKERAASDTLLEKSGVFAPVRKMDWVRQLVAWQKEIADSREYLDAVRFDALGHRNFVFFASRRCF